MEINHLANVRRQIKVKLKGQGLVFIPSQLAGANLKAVIQFVGHMLHCFSWNVVCEGHEHNQSHARNCGYLRI